MHGLRVLERRLVQERAEIGVREAVDHLLRSWDHALTRGSSPPDPLVFFKTLAEAGVYLPTSQKALQYLAQCRLAASLPVRDRLLRMLLPPGALRGPS